MTAVAYLVSDYFAASHTFVRREVASLRKSGIRVVPFSIQSTGPVKSDVQHILGRSPFDYIFALMWLAITRPYPFCSSWKLACTHRAPGLRGLIWSQFHFVEAMMLARLLKAQGCFHLHNHFANSAATVGMIAAHYLKIPWSLTLHGISETDYPAGVLLARKLERAAFIACASFFMQAQAMRMVSYNHWGKMHIVRCGIDLESLPPINRKNKLHQENPVELICVGRLSAEKGYFGFLDSLARLAEQGSEFSLTIVGDGPSASEIHQRATDLKLDDKIRFTGALPEGDTLAAINAADILVLPSLMEGLPVVLIEALALGKAVIATRIAGIPELIEDKRTGLMFTPSDWADLQRQIKRLLEDEDLRKAIGANGVLKVAAEFTSEQSTSIMSRLLAGPHGGSLGNHIPK
jgi:glycosyltransferase involved in cell wall biosynthesis